MKQVLNLNSITKYSPKLLLIDDDAEIRDLLHKLLSKHGMIVSEAQNGNEILSKINAEKFDVVLLDIMLGENDGFEICKQIRNTSNIPIIMISAANEPTDRVLGLELGADDYITKPFYAREVIARIKAVLRRNNYNHEIKKITHSKKMVYFSGWSLDKNTRRLLDPDQIEISLSVGEYVLLEALIENANRIITRDQLLSYIHTFHEQEVFDRSIDVQICRLRKRIEINPGKPTLIKTIRGEGYMFDTIIHENAPNNYRS